MNCEHLRRSLQGGEISRLMGFAVLVLYKEGADAKC